MGKSTYVGQVPKDDPMFFGGPQIFSRPGSKPSSASIPGSADEVKLAAADSQPKQQPKDKPVE